MAIQIPNPGTGNGATGDNEFVLWSKVKDNFSDQTNAASRLVGTNTGQIPLAGDVFEALARKALNVNNGYENFDDLPYGFRGLLPKTLENSPTELTGIANSVLTECYQVLGGTGTGMQVAYEISNGSMAIRTKYSTRWGDWAYFYHSGNTTKDSNGFLKGKSPVTRLFSDRLEHQGEDKELQGIEFKRLGVGDYLLKNTTGLSNDGWYIELPQDANKNPLFAIIYNDDGKGDLSIKTYKRRFDFETVSIVADTDNPVDIPETRWVDLRFNELPQEHLYDIQTEV